MKPDKTSSCTRVYANEKQIAACRKRIVSLEEPIAYVADVLSLAGNEARLKILFLLKEEGELCPCDISDILSMTVPAVSQHLRKLKDGKLVSAKKTGQTIFYSLTPEAGKLLHSHFKFFENTVQASSL